MKIKLISLIGLLFAISCATIQAQKPVVKPEIYEIKSMSEIENWIIPDTLLLFDLDNTVFEAKNIQAHANFFHDILKKYPEQQAKLLQKAWTAIKKSEYKLIESITPTVIQSLQNRDIAVMALTSRDLDLKDVTLKQVNSVGIDFSKTSPTKKSKYFHQGILFADNNYPKGLALLAYLKGTGFRPKRIVFVDDLKKNLDSVCEATGAIGLFYPLVDNKRHLEWDEEKAEQLWLEE